MSEKEINKQAYEQAQKEMLENRVKEIKGYILETLEKIEEKKKVKERVEEELRILKLDLEDLRNGKFDKIEERLIKSKKARDVSVIQEVHFYSASPNFTTISPYTYSSSSSGSCSSSMTLNNLANCSTDWLNLTAGTYPTADGKIFYL